MPEQRYVWILVGLSGEPDLAQDHEPEGWDGIYYDNGYGHWALDIYGHEIWYRLPLRSKTDG